MNVLFSVLVGVVIGALSSLGIGGGSLLMLWLTLAIGMDARPARLINLMFFLPCALIACLFRLRQGRLNRAVAVPTVAAGCAGSVIGCLLGGLVDVDLLQRIFGGVLILFGIREIFYRPRKAR